MRRENVLSGTTRLPYIKKNPKVRDSIFEFHFSLFICQNSIKTQSTLNNAILPSNFCKRRSQSGNGNYK